MPPYQPQLRPVALSGQILNLQPDNELRRVRDVEPMAQIGPIDFGAATSGSTATDANGNAEIEVTEVEMAQNQLGQYRIHPISPVEVNLRQTGRQEQRMTNANTETAWTPNTPPQLREFFVFEADNPYLVINNPQTYDLDTTRIKFNGFKYNLEREPLTESQVDSQPINVPVDKLEQSTQRSGSRAAQRQAAVQGRGR